MAERVYLTVGEVLEIHRQQIDDYGGVQGIRDKALLESAVFRPQIGYYNTVAEEAAALMESLPNNQPFLDGNKRVAFAAAHTFLLVNGFDLDVQPRCSPSQQGSSVLDQFSSGSTITFEQAEI
jgi:death on curing protein